MSLGQHNGKIKLSALLLRKVASSNCNKPFPFKGNGLFFYKISSKRIPRDALRKTVLSFAMFSYSAVNRFNSTEKSNHCFVEELLAGRGMIS